MGVLPSYHQFLGWIWNQPSNYWGCPIVGHIHIVFFSYKNQFWFSYYNHIVTWRTYNKHTCSDNNQFFSGINWGTHDWMVLLMDVPIENRWFGGDPMTDWGYMIYDIWYMIFDIWYMIYDIWYMVYDIWYMIDDIWYLIYGIWYMIFDIWYMIYDIW